MFLLKQWKGNIYIIISNKTQSWKRMTAPPWQHHHHSTPLKLTAFSTPNDNEATPVTAPSPQCARTSRFCGFMICLAWIWWQFYHLMKQMTLYHTHKHTCTHTHVQVHLHTCAVRTYIHCIHNVDTCSWLPRIWGVPHQKQGVKQP